MNRIWIKRGTFCAVIVGFLLTFVGVIASADKLSDDKSRNASGALIATHDSINRPAIVIAHRGASGSRPEHTMAAYEMALVEGADFIELDLVATKEGALIARHENALAMVALDDAGEVLLEGDGTPKFLEATTDVADHPEFADRLTVKSIDGRLIGGWFSEDFTLAEIRRLRARERLPAIRPGNRLYDDRFGVPTLHEAIGLLRTFESRTGRRPGLYLEIKHPTYFQHEGLRLDGSSIGIDLGERLLEELRQADFLAAERIFIQAFEVAPLMALKDRMAASGLALPLIQLFGDTSNARYRAVPRDLTYHATAGSLGVYGELESRIVGGIRSDTSYAELATPAVLRFMAERYAAGIGPTRQNVLVTRPADGIPGRLAVTGEFAPLLIDARGAGLLVHPYTLRSETPFLFINGDRLLTVAEEAALMLRGGVAGFFIDQPAEGRLAVDRYQAGLPVFDPLP